MRKKKKDGVNDDEEKMYVGFCNFDTSFDVSKSIVNDYSNDPSN